MFSAAVLVSVSPWRWRLRMSASLRPEAKVCEVQRDASAQARGRSLSASQRPHGPRSQVYAQSRRREIQARGRCP